jgi:GT2 family glycosyltransferase
LIRAYDFTLAPATQLLVKYLLRLGTVFYGGNFAVRREALAWIGGFDTSIEFHGEDTNLGRRLFAIGKVSLFHDCFLYTSARRYVAMGKGAVFRLYVRNFTSELLRHRPRDTTHVDVRI